MKRRFLGIFLAVLLLLSLCVGAFAEASKPEVVMWGWSDDWRRSFEDYMAAESPDITFEYVVVNGDDYLQKLQTSAAAGTRMPDVAAMEMGWRGKAIALGIFENLEAEPYNLDRSEMMDFLIPLCTDKDDIVRGVEIQPAPGGLAYRRDLALQYFGTDDAQELEKMFSSWDDFITIGRKCLKRATAPSRCSPASTTWRIS